MTCALNRTTWTLTFDVPEIATRVSVPVAPEVQRDFLGRPISSSVGVGPFANLAPGSQRIELHLPATARDAQSPAEWIAK